MIDVYGITNCDTVKKARKWLDRHNVAYVFHDFKKVPPEKTMVEDWLNTVGANMLVNKRGSTYRKLSQDDKEMMDDSESGLIELLIRFPSLIKRPVMLLDNKVSVGFDETTYSDLLL